MSYAQQHLENLKNQEILTYVQNNIGHICLNRRQSMNALSLHMIQMIGYHINEWLNNDNVAIDAVLITSTSAPKVFSAGGDIKAMYHILTNKQQTHENNINQARHQINEEYRLIDLLADQSQALPIISYVDGICFGAGAGIAVNSDFTIANEHSLFAMPECRIGLFPDVRAVKFLNKTPGLFGLYCALTGARVNGADMVDMGLAQYYIPSKYYPKLHEALYHIPWQEWDRHDALDHLFNRFHETPTEYKYRPMLDWINDVFHSHDYDELLENLKRDKKHKDKQKQEWAKQTWDMITISSPFALRRTFEYFTQGAAMAPHFAGQCDRIMFDKFVDHPDLITGIASVVIDKTDKPKWKRLRRSDSEIMQDLRRFFE